MATALENKRHILLFNALFDKPQFLDQNLNFQEIAKYINQYGAFLGPTFKMQPCKYQNCLIKGCTYAHKQTVLMASQAAKQFLQKAEQTTEMSYHSIPVMDAYTNQVHYLVMQTSHDLISNQMYTQPVSIYYPQIQPAPILNSATGFNQSNNELPQPPNGPTRECSEETQNDWEEIQREINNAVTSDEGDYGA